MNRILFRLNEREAGEHYSIWPLNQHSCTHGHLLGTFDLAVSSMTFKADWLGTAFSLRSHLEYSVLSKIGNHRKRSLMFAQLHDYYISSAATPNPQTCRKHSLKGKHIVSFNSDMMIRSLESHSAQCGTGVAYQSTYTEHEPTESLEPRVQRLLVSPITLDEITR